jgi:hypothetical protein
LSGLGVQSNLIAEKVGGRFDDVDLRVEVAAELVIM